MSQPNVIFVLADQWRADALGANGDSWVQTPVLDALAARGVIQANYHLGGLSPAVCVPARAALRMSLYPSRPPTGPLSESRPTPASMASGK